MASVNTDTVEFLPFGRERRLEAKAFADWDALRGHRSMPPVDACDRATVRSGATTWHVIAPDKGNASPEQPGDDAGLAALSRAVLACWCEIAAAGAPRQVSVRTAGLAWRGMLLPFALADGRLGAVQAVATQIEAPRIGDLAGVSAILSSVHRTPPRLPPASPWAAAGGAVRLLDQPRTQPLGLAECLAVARTWAALGAGSARPGRTGRLHAALAGAFDLLCADRADPRGLSPARVADLVFGDGFSASERRDFAMALAHGERLGLDRSGFASLLERFPEGYHGLAMAEEGVGETTEQDEDAAPDEIVLEPLDVRLLARLGRRDAGKASWTPHRAAA